MNSWGRVKVRSVVAFSGVLGLLFLAACPINFYGTLDQGGVTTGQTGGGTGQTIVLTIFPSQVTLSPSSSVTFSAVGGVPPYAFSILSGSGSFSGAVFTAPGSAGTTTVQVIDAAAGKSYATVTIVPPPLSISPTSVSVYTGSSFTFTASGGTAPYTYNITSGGGTLSGATYNAPVSPGSATVQVTDSASATSSASITITTPPSPLSITPEPLVSRSMAPSRSQPAAAFRRTRSCRRWAAERSLDQRIRLLPPPGQRASRSETPS